MVDYTSHQQARPQLATKLVKSGATADSQNFNYYDPYAQEPTSELISEVDEAKMKEDRFMSHLDTEDYHMSDEQALLCPARVRGYAFALKIWVFLLVEQIREVEWVEDAFEKLEMNETMKMAVQALVQTHSECAEQFDDMMPGKGKGLVFLLHGPPGLGKTLTAGILVLFSSYTGIRVC
jgi:hypothetical protein